MGHYSPFLLTSLLLYFFFSPPLPSFRQLNGLLITLICICSKPLSGPFTNPLHTFNHWWVPWSKLCLPLGIILSKVLLFLRCQSAECLGEKYPLNYLTQSCKWLKHPPPSFPSSPSNSPRTIRIWNILSTLRSCRDHASDDRDAKSKPGERSRWFSFSTSRNHPSHHPQVP